MKVTAVLLLALIVVVAAKNRCPKKQVSNWKIEFLYEHEDCDKFYKCAYGKPVEQQCPAGLFYNIESQECDYRYNVDCGDRNVPKRPGNGVNKPGNVESIEQENDQETPEVVESNESSESGSNQQPGDDKPNEVPIVEVNIDFLDNGCPVSPHIHWLLPHDRSCSFYYYCVNGKKILRRCPGLLHFNPLSQVCDWPRSAGCESNRPNNRPRM